MTWFKLNSLEANPDKFQSMLISSNVQKDNDFHIEVRDNDITATTTIKIFGIHIDSKLNFNNYTAFLCTKTSGQLNVLQRMRVSLDYVSRMAIYNSFVTSNFNYCPVVWMFTSKSSLNKLKNIQKRALRFVWNGFVSHYSTWMKWFLWRNVHDLRDDSLPERTAARQIMVPNLSEVVVLKYGTYSQQYIKSGCHLIHSKTWSKLGLGQPANVVSTVCLELDFPVISI